MKTLLNSVPFFWKYLKPSFAASLLACLLCLVNLANAQPICKTDRISMEWCDATTAEYEKKQADKKLSSTYKKFIAQFTGDVKMSWVEAQRAWVKFFDLHCGAVVEIHASSPATREYNFQRCLKEQIVQRTEVLKSFCQTDECAR
jgi:uncharacterized protein YecT (DUF1311 family)